jgi:hypothetical protein
LYYGSTYVKSFGTVFTSDVNKKKFHVLNLLYLFGVVTDNFLGGNIGRGNVYEGGSDSYGALRYR